MIKQKTDAQWNQIRFQNSLGPQIGGLIHDAVALVIAHKRKDRTAVDVKRGIETWLDILYEISEQKKAELAEVKPLNEKKAVEQGQDWQKKQEEIVEEGRQINNEDKQ